MDEKTTISELKERIRQFCDARDWDQFHSAKNLACGAVTEASELLEHFRFVDGPEIDLLFDNPKKREAIADEIADTLYFLFRFAQLYNIDISTEFERKLQKTEAKYPIEKAKGSNLSYKEL